MAAMTKLICLLVLLFIVPSIYSRSHHTSKRSPPPSKHHTHAHSPPPPNKHHSHAHSPPPPRKSHSSKKSTSTGTISTLNGDGHYSTGAHTVKYRPVCKNYTDPPSNGWLKWSEKSTWVGGVIPGVGAGAGAVANIPCNTGIILDTNVTLDRLVINGWLKVVDAGPFSVTANFVIVQGKLTIGTKAAPYTGKITFTLTLGNYSYGWIRPDGEDNAGVKAFVVLGGLVELNGAYGHSKTWTTISKTAKAGDSSIHVSGDVSSWPIGSQIALASTDYDSNQAEKKVIVSIQQDSSGTVVNLDSPLKYNHWGDAITVKSARVRPAAEVALLSRAIVIQGAVEAKSPTLGGHFVVFQTEEPQYIQGVELVNMGQRGQYGRYPLYFYLSQDQSHSVVRQVSIHESNQRCIVLKGVWKLTLDENVAYNTVGHCFFLEDGVEYGNNITNNLGIATKKGISHLQGSTTVQSDEFASTFWITNPENTLVGNVAAGSEDTGIWYHLSNMVYGASRQFPQAKNVFPRNTALTKFEGNTFHSNGRAGLRFWPDGFRPRKYKPTDSKITLHTPATATLTNVVGYKNGQHGIFISKSDNIEIINGQFSDNRVAAVAIFDAENINIVGGVIFGETPNYGNPAGCSMSSGMANPTCEPLSGCALPVSPSLARSVGVGASVASTVPVVGVILTQASLAYDTYSKQFAGGFYPYPNSINDVSFGYFTNRNCKQSAAIAASGDARRLFLPSHFSTRLSFEDSSPQFFMAPEMFGVNSKSVSVDAGNAANSYVFHDKDGTITGGHGGYVVTDNAAILPDGKKCAGILGGGYGYLCPGTCYREVAFETSDKSTPNITLTKSSGRASISTKGNPGFVNLPASTPYHVQFDSAPKYVSFSYADVMGCSDSAQLRYVAPKGKHWEVALISDEKVCSGKSTSTACKISSKVVCGSGSAGDSLEVILGGQSQAKVTLYLGSGSYSECTKKKAVSLSSSTVTAV